MIKYIKFSLTAVPMCAIFLSSTVAFGSDKSEYLNKKNFYFNANAGVAFPNKIKKYLYNLQVQDEYMGVKPKKVWFTV